MGPAAAAVGIGFWWLLASRATLRERFVVLGGVVAALILANLATVSAWASDGATLSLADASGALGEG